jgi:imidazoleglycerol phosphate dehydratase HisB
VKDKSTNLQTLLARIFDGNRNVYSASSHYKNRLTIHRNGSLEITSLHPDDETQYKCLVKQGGRKLHVVKLNVTCGKYNKYSVEIVEFIFS